MFSNRVVRVPTIRFAIVLFVLAILKPNFCFGDDNLDAVIAKIVKTRDYTSQFVVLAKQSFKQGSPQYNQAFKLYAAAYSDYGSWNAYLTSALAAGRINGRKPLPNDSKYDDLSAAATKSSTAFVNYVDANTPGQEKAVVAVLASLADLGLKLWTGISQKREQDRTALSKRFADATQWQAWNQITDGSTAPKAAPPASSDKPVSPPSKPNTPQ